MSEPTPEPEGSAGPFAPEELGARLQGLLLGVPLFFALLRLFSMTDGEALFRYQGF